VFDAASACEAGVSIPFSTAAFRSVVSVVRVHPSTFKTLPSTVTLPNPRHAARVPAHIAPEQLARIRQHAYALPQVVKPADWFDEHGSGLDERLDKLGLILLQKAVAALKADKAKALSQFAKGENGFRDRDLYPFCGGADGTFTAHPTLTGKSMKDLKGSDGELVGTRLYDSAKEGEISEVEYVWPKPGASAPSPKVSYVTKVGDQVCAVGYYK